MPHKNYIPAERAKNIGWPLLLKAAVEVERLCHGGPPGPTCEVNFDRWGALYPDGTEAWADDYLFPKSSYSEGAHLAQEVLKWLGGAS